MRTIYLNSDRSVKFWKQKGFFNRSDTLEQLEFKLAKIIGIWKHAGKFKRN